MFRSLAVSQVSPTGSKLKSLTGISLEIHTGKFSVFPKEAQKAGSRSFAETVRQGAPGMLWFRIQKAVMTCIITSMSNPLICRLHPASARASGAGHRGASWTSSQKCFSAWTSTVSLCLACGWRRRCSLLGSLHRGSQQSRRTTSHNRY